MLNWWINRKYSKAIDRIGKEAVDYFASRHLSTPRKVNIRIETPEDRIRCINENKLPNSYYIDFCLSPHNCSTYNGEWPAAEIYEHLSPYLKEDAEFIFILPNSSFLISNNLTNGKQYLNHRAVVVIRELEWYKKEEEDRKKYRYYSLEIRFEIKNKGGNNIVEESELDERALYQKKVKETWEKYCKDKPDLHQNMAATLRDNGLSLFNILFGFEIT